MEFDIENFLEKMQATAFSRGDSTQKIYDEIHAAESQKLGFLDQATENPDFFKFLSSQVDSYITRLKELHNMIDVKDNLQPDEQVYQTDKVLINRTMQLVRQLDQVEQDRLGTGQAGPQKSNLNDTD